MMKSVTWDATTGQLVVKFPYTVATREQVKEIHGRSWDPGTKTWRFSRSDAPRALEALRAIGFVVDPSVTAALSPATGEISVSGRSPPTQDLRVSPVTREFGAQTGSRAGGRTGDLAGAAGVSSGALPVGVAATGLTVSALNRRLASAVKREFPGAVWLLAEVAKITRKSGQNFVYLELVERVDGEVVARTSANMPVAVWADAVRSLERYGLEPEVGLRVRVSGRPSVWEARGDVQFRIEAVDAEYAAAALQAPRERILAALREEGLAERNRGLPWPVPALRLAVLTSAGSDAWGDLEKTLGASRFAFSVTVFDVRVQGERLEGTVVRALAEVRRHASSFDVCVITRGGGSRTELATWDNEAVARAVATLPVKVVVAIGHEHDRCVLDDIAESCRTPTEAGRLLRDRVEGLWESVGRLASRMTEAASRRTRDREVALDVIGERLIASTRLAVAGRKGALDHGYPERIRARVAARLAREDGRVARAEATLDAERLERRVQAYTERIDRLMGRLEVLPERALSDRGRALDQLAARLEVLPERALSDRGRAVDRLVSRLAMLPSRAIDARRAKVVHLTRRLELAALNAVQRADATLALRVAQTAALAPEATMRRGWAIVSAAGGRTLRSVRDVSPGSDVQIRLADGRMDATVTRVLPGREEERG